MFSIGSSTQSSRGKAIRGPVADADARRRLFDSWMSGLRVGSIMRWSSSSVIALVRCLRAMKSKT